MLLPALDIAGRLLQLRPPVLAVTAVPGRVLGPGTARLLGLVTAMLGARLDTLLASQQGGRVESRGGWPWRSTRRSSGRYRVGELGRWPRVLLAGALQASTL